MKHTMKLHERPYKLILNGVKTIELRLYDDKRKRISVGDEIEFINSVDSNLSLSCTVVALHRFSSFEELYKKLPLLKCGYTRKDIASAAPKDMDLYYSKDEQKAYGVIGIEVELKGKL